MTKLTVKILAAMGTAMLLVAFLPVALAGEQAADLDQPAECTALEAETLALGQAVEGLAGKPVVGPNCLSNQRLTCASMPIPVGGTCSCTSALLQKKCKTCETGNKGQVLSTTCTVYAPCQTEPCDVQQNFSRTGQSCTG